MSNPYGGAPGDGGYNEPPGPGGPYNPYGGTGQPGGVDPGEGMGRVGMILSCIPCCLIWVVGGILCIIAHNQSKQAGFQNRFTKIGFIMCAIWGALYVVGLFINGATGLFSNFR